jgi:hypothetical protein
MTFTSEFDLKRIALIVACRRIGIAVLDTSYSCKTAVSNCLLRVADTLDSEATFDTKKDVTNSLRSLFHKEGFHEYPAPPSCPTWDNDTNLIFDYSTIYVESRYNAAEQDAAANP